MEGSANHNDLQRGFRRDHGCPRNGHRFWHSRQRIHGRFGHFSGGRDQVGFPIHSVEILGFFYRSDFR